MKQFLTLDYLLHFGMRGPLVSFLGFYILNIQITNLTLFIYRNIYTQQNKSELIIHITYKVACIHVVTTEYKHTSPGLLEWNQKCSDKW